MMSETQTTLDDIPLGIILGKGLGSIENLTPASADVYSFQLIPITSSTGQLTALTQSSISQVSLLSDSSFVNLPPWLVPTAIQVMKFSGRFVTISGAYSTFSWIGFTISMWLYKSPYLNLDNTFSNAVTQSSCQVWQMAYKVADLLYQALPTGSVDVSALAATIEATFCNLKTVKSSGFLSFNKSTHESNSSWEYRIQSALPPRSDDPNLFWSVISTVTLEADIKEESSWWGLEHHTTKRFSAYVTSARLAVRKGFIAP
ncbi:hypothetical protein QCA50_016605 [Cerrena zonata]|uniref:Uncharacterized protein n=1 Tax=Cerrena zonata TaxID=2478898 RepID=A0AAW0FUG8_9APHY